MRTRVAALAVRLVAMEDEGGSVRSVRVRALALARRGGCASLHPTSTCMCATMQKRDKPSTPGVGATVHADGTVPMGAVRVAPKIVS